MASPRGNAERWTARSPPRWAMPRPSIGPARWCCSRRPPPPSINSQASRSVAMLGLLIALALTAVTLFAGQEIKGARRWVDLAGLSLQPSEFLKPCFAVTAAWLFAEQHGQRRLPGNILSILLYLVVVALLM